MLYYWKLNANGLKNLKCEIVDFVSYLVLFIGQCLINVINVISMKYNNTQQKERLLRVAIYIYPPPPPKIEAQTSHKSCKIFRIKFAV